MMDKSREKELEEADTSPDEYYFLGHFGLLNEPYTPWELSFAGLRTDLNKESCARSPIVVTKYGKIIKP